ncbi:Sad1 / UNC-like C-terminal domain containing protein [Euroglyphus maynei]|uniref:Sad1 / UNC-like C-terminal domain containing protein n=1 Tax=Euroglyphus maynei TaxID=6958 RepID=A0A1Y3BYB4_EURMA|nr:Sad1 / UNC-like C-terminal domain containing protein [Euroglyphus maynei]
MIIQDDGGDKISFDSQLKLPNITSRVKRQTHDHVRELSPPKCANTIATKWFHYSPSSLPICMKESHSVNGEKQTDVNFQDEKLVISSQTMIANDVTDNDSIVLNQSLDQQQSSLSGDNFVGPLIQMKPSVVSSQDMLSFEEWRSKISEQMERENKIEIESKFANEMVGKPDLVIDQINGQKLMKITTNRARNFASHECGAKIVDSNSEANFVNRVLNEQLDEYMLNPCKIKNWFVIELCETIQPQYLEMANFELYSSIPKDFTVFACEQYPNRNGWSPLGNFTANDIRSLQGFKLQNNGFVKFLKIELSSFYGSEHYCPISLIRVFGTSLFDEVERIDNPEKSSIDFDDHNSVHEETTPISMSENLKAKNFTDLDLFGSAKNAVEKMTKMNDTDSNFDIYNQTEIVRLYPYFEHMMNECETYFFPANDAMNQTSCVHIPNKCLFYQLLFRDQQLFKLMSTQYLIRKYFNNKLFFQCGYANETQTINTTPSSVAVEQLVQLTNGNNNHSISHVNNNDDVQSIVVQISEENLSTKSPFISSTIMFSSTSTVNNKIPDVPIINVTTLEPSLTEPTISEPIVTMNTLSPTNTYQTQIISTSSTFEPQSGHGSSSSLSSQPSNETSNQFQTVDSNQPILNLFEQEADVQSFSSMSGQSKEAVIVRLTNRIKNLEKNISLMSTYLENLSVRYRKQMEEMQAIFNQTFDHFNTSARVAAEKDARQQEQIMKLQNEIIGLNQRFTSLFKDIEKSNWLFLRIHLGLMIIELTIVGIFCLIFYLGFKHNLNRILKAHLHRDDRQPTSLSSTTTTNNQSNTQLSPDVKVGFSDTIKAFKNIQYHRSKSLSDLQLLITNDQYFVSSFKNKRDEFVKQKEQDEDCNKENIHCDIHDHHHNLNDEPTMTDDDMVPKIFKVINQNVH